VALTDKDQDGFKAWDGVGTAPKEGTVLDPNDNDPKVTPVSNDSSSNDANYQAWLKQQNLLNKPSISVSTEAETTADIEAEFQAAFGDSVPKAIAKAYYNDVRALQGKRVTGGTSATSKVNVNVQGVSAQEIKAIQQKYLTAAAADRISLAESGDPVAKAALSKGNFGVTYTTLKNAYVDNGIPVNTKSLGQLVVDSLADPNKMKGNLNLINLQAKTYFPALADKIDNGYTVKQLLTPYLNTRANILEEDPDTIDIKTLQGIAKDPKGLMNLYDYEVSLRNDPKWRFTKNAQDTMGGLANSIAKTFGLVG
jgi:hypothetical protein